MTIFLLLIVIAFVFFAYHTLVSKRFNNLCFCSDEDMKIANGIHSSNFFKKDSDDSIAREFIKNRDNGNIEIANKIGIDYAETLIYNNNLINFDNNSCFDNELLIQKYILFSFAVKAVAEDFSPNTVVSQKIITSFYNTVESISQAYYNIISESFSFSFYILWKRNTNISSEPIGNVFAKLLNKIGDESAIELGNKLYKQYYEYCVNIFNQKSFN